MKVEKKSELIGRGGVYRRPVDGTEEAGKKYLERRCIAIEHWQKYGENKLQYLGNEEDFECKVLFNEIFRKGNDGR